MAAIPGANRVNSTPVRAAADDAIRLLIRGENNENAVVRCGPVFRELSGVPRGERAELRDQNQHREDDAEANEDSTQARQKRSGVGTLRIGQMFSPEYATRAIGRIE